MVSGAPARPGGRETGQAAEKPAAERRSVPGHRQRQPFPGRHPAGRPPRRAERADQREAADTAGNPRRARRGERPAGRDAQQRRRLSPQPVQHQRRILHPIRQPAQPTRISPADAGPVRDHDAQSQLARRLGEQACRQPRIGQPVAQENRRRALLASNLNRDHAAVAPAHLHRPMVSRSGRPLPTRRPRKRPGPRQRGLASKSWIFPAEPGAHRLTASHHGARRAERGSLDVPPRRTESERLRTVLSWWADARR